jgi:hypothetical protein
MLSSLKRRAIELWNAAVTAGEQAMERKLLEYGRSPAPKTEPPPLDPAKLHKPHEQPRVNRTSSYSASFDERCALGDMEPRHRELIPYAAFISGHVPGIVWRNPQTGEKVCERLASGTRFRG